MLLGELQTMASSLGISGTAKMRKGDLIAAIEQNQADGRVPRARAEQPTRGQVAARGESPRTEVRAEVREGEAEAPTVQRGPRRASRAAGPPEPREDRVESRDERESSRATNDRQPHDRGSNDRFDGAERRERADRNGSERAGAERNGRDSDRGGADRADRNGRVDRDRMPAHDRGGHERGSDDDEESGRRGRRSRFRDRRRGRGERGGESMGGGAEPQVSDDDVLVQIAGIVDVLDNYAFIRTSGYLSGPNDVYVSMAQIKRYGLRRGDAVTGAVRAPRDGEQRRDKYNPLVRLDTINGMDPEEARRRPEFYKLTPLYPQERLRLETDPHILTTRVIDLVMPIGKGQRALIVSPPKAGKTMIQQAIANAITKNNPE